MPEHQYIEYKQIWQDDILKCIAAFVNSQGGIIYIGKDDKGKITGLSNFQRLLEDLPNKIRDVLGIMVEVNLMHMLEEVASVLNLKFFTRTVSFEGLQRIEKGEYPVAALREMLLNSLVHREYSGGAVQIRMYDHYFSIWNEGTLPVGLSIDSLKRRHPSRPRNPLIADICFKGGYIDAWGRGTLSIFSSCLEAGLPEPEIQQQDGGVMVTLFKSSPIKVQLDRTDLNYRQHETLIHLKEKGIISSGEYANKFGVADRTARRDLAEMCAIGLIEKIGENKSLKYRLIVR